MARRGESERARRTNHMLLGLVRSEPLPASPTTASIAAAAAENSGQPIFKEDSRRDFWKPWSPYWARGEFPTARRQP